MRHRAIGLRVEPTIAEAKLWGYLRDRELDGIKFRRQHAIGRYVVDFCSPRSKLVIELDGSQHLGHEGQDARRTQFLESQGYQVVRFWNDQVMNDFEGVVRAIQLALEEA
jgi:very-short-patch-repair endonuclease